MKGFSVDSASKKSVRKSKQKKADPEAWRESGVIDTRRPQWAHLAQKWGRK